jgi:hypothetical protein
MRITAAHSPTTVRPTEQENATSSSQPAPPAIDPYQDVYEGPSSGGAGALGYGAAGAQPYGGASAPVQVPVGTDFPIDGQAPGSRLYENNPHLDPSGRPTSWAHYDSEGRIVGRGDNVQMHPHRNPDGTVIPGNEPHYHPANLNTNPNTGVTHVNGYDRQAIPLGPDAPLTPSDIPIDPHLPQPSRLTRLWNGAVPYLRPLGTAAMAAGAAYDVYNIATSDNPARTAAGAVGGWAGAASFGYAGASLGFAVGGPVGAAVGGVIGGGIGYFAGHRAGTNIYEAAS